jgi:hypothetical protein
LSIVLQLVGGVNSLRLQVSKLGRVLYSASLYIRRLFMFEDVLHLGQFIFGGALRGCNQKFPDWPPGARTASEYTSLPLGAVVSLFCESV